MCYAPYKTHTHVHTCITHTHIHMHINTRTHIHINTVTKRQLASSPFTSPLVKQPCVRAPDGDLDGDELAPPLSLADLQMDTYDLTDPSLIVKTGGTPLHSTASLARPQWWQAPVHSTAVESQHLATSSGPQASSADSGIATSVEFGSTSSGMSNFSKASVTKGLWCTQPSLSEEEAGLGQSSEVQCHGNEHWTQQHPTRDWTLQTHAHNRDDLDTCTQHCFVANPAVCVVPTASMGLGTPPGNALLPHYTTSLGYRNQSPHGGLLPSRFRTPSRYSDLRLGSTPTLKSCGVSCIAGDVLRKKEALKAKMRFGELQHPKLFVAFNLEKFLPCQQICQFK